MKGTLLTHSTLASLFLSGGGPHWDGGAGRTNARRKEGRKEGRKVCMRKLMVNSDLTQ